MFRLENIKKSYNGKLALDIEDLEIQGNGIMGIFGPNGSGKTTLLNILSLLDFAYEGKLWFKQRVIRPPVDYKNLRRKLSLLMEHPYFFKGTVFDNMSYGLKVRGLTKTEILDRVKNTLKKVGLTHFSNYKVEALSGGEKQRLALARILILNTEIILLDEPTLRMDREYVEMFESIISDYSKNRMVIMTSHNLPQVHHLANKVIYLKEGRIVKYGISKFSKDARLP